MKLARESLWTPRGWARSRLGAKFTRSPATSPGSADAHSDDAGGIFAFCARISTAWRGGGLLLFVPGGVLLLGGLERQILRDVARSHTNEKTL